MAPLTVKLVKRTPLLYDSFERLWEVVRDALEHIFLDEPSKVSFQRVYRAVYDIVLLGESSNFYSQMKTYFNDKMILLREETFSNIDDLMKAEVCPNNVHLFNNFWLSLNQRFKWVGDLMLYFDKVYSVPKRSLQVIDLCYSIFYQNILSPLSSFLLYSVISTINSIRKRLSQSDDQCVLLPEEQNIIEQVTSLISMMELITVDNATQYSFYTKVFESYLLENVDIFFSTSINWEGMSPLDTFYKIQKLISTEQYLSKKLFNDDTCNKIFKKLAKVLVEGKAISIVDSLIQVALSDLDKTLLKEILHLNMECEEYLTKCYNSIKLYILNDLKNSIHLDISLKRRSLIGVKWASEVIKKRECYLKLLDIHYPKGCDASGFLVDESFQKYLNLDIKQSTEFLCYIIDAQLKRSPSMSLTPEVINKEFRPIIKLVEALPETDTFMETYKVMLSKRLLHQRYTYEWEVNILKKLSYEIGSYYTGNIETMLKDILISGDLSRIMKATHGSKYTDPQLSSFEFHPNILTMTAWPFEPINEQENQQIILPKCMQAQLDDFEMVYRKKYNQRLLKWCHSLGLVEVTYWFGEGNDLRKYDLLLPFYSAIVFLSVLEYDSIENDNNKEPLTLDRIHHATGLSIAEVTRQLVSLSIAPRFRILKKTPEGSTIKPSDIFSVNEDFRSSTDIVRVKTVNIKSISGPSADTRLNTNMEKILERDRFITTNATVVRIMKQEKTLTEIELFERCQAVLKPRFSLENKTFHHSIRHLLDKEYLATDPDDSKVYRYL